jgi:hypothetical protein
MCAIMTALRLIDGERDYLKGVINKDKRQRQIAEDEWTRLSMVSDDLRTILDARSERKRLLDEE